MNQNQLSHVQLCGSVFPKRIQRITINENKVNCFEHRGTKC